MNRLQWRHLEDINCIMTLSDSTVPSRAVCPSIRPGVWHVLYYFFHRLVDHHSSFCRVMLCISAAYAVMRCLCVCLCVCFPYQTLWLYSDGDLVIGANLRFSTNIWWDQWLLERWIWSKVVTLSGGVCLSRQTGDETPCISESSLWQQSSMKKLCVICV